MLNNVRGTIANALRGWLLAGLLAACLPAAAWELDNSRSVVNFISVKNASIAELHYFRSVTGGIDAEGNATLVIDLDSVETLIPIRNQRLRELLFETVRFPSATLSAQVPKTLLDLDVGATQTATIDVTVELHGDSRDYSSAVLVTAAEDGSLQVTLREPLLVNAGDFGLAAGVDVLREVAGLKSISTAIPVSAHLVFAPAEQ